MFARWIASGLCVLALALQDEESPKKLLASSKVVDRLWGVFALARDANEPKAEDMLLPLLHDPDWEVIEKAAEALGQLGTERSIAPLVDLVVSGDIERVRLAAARSIGKLGAKPGVAALATRLKGDDVALRIDALAAIGGDDAVAVLEKLADAKDPDRKRAARIALGLAGGEAQFPRFEAMLKDSDLELRIAGMRGLARVASTQSLALLIEKLAKESSDVEERRLREACVKCLVARARDERPQFFSAIESAAKRTATSRHARLLLDIGAHSELSDLKKPCVATLEAMIGASDASTRSAAIHALGRVGDADREHVAKVVEERLLRDSELRVRFHALRALVALLGPDAATLVSGRIESDPAPELREEAAALAGSAKLAATEAALIRALTDDSWQVSATAAISLGKLRARDAKRPLIEMLGHKLWKRRGAAALALAWLRDADAVDAIIDRGMVETDDTVRATILHALKRITGQQKFEKVGSWQAWWKKNRATARFVDDRGSAKAARDERYDAATSYSFFDDLDVISIVSPRPGGDHIEQLLERSTIKHRLAQAGKVADATLHPFAIGVVNCSGELLPDDIDRIEWFVHCGGYLFSSCWGLTHTVGKAFPGVVQMHPTGNQVLDTVEAVGLSDSGLMRGVLRPATRTRYVLEGSHLISVIDDERFETLIDSPQCATRWGEGNLAGYFTIGHGVVFDSANHFDLQGMKRDIPKLAKERRAMAMDVLGYDHAEARDLDSRGVFRSDKKCAEQLEDLSMLRLIGNFVQKKRMAEW